MHAIWFSFIVPALVATVWIGPKLRASKVWFGLCLATLIGTTIWLGVDLGYFINGGGAIVDLPRRLLYVFLSETGKPVLPVMLGSFLAGRFCRRYPEQSSSTQRPFSGDGTAAENVQPDAAT